MRKLFVNPTLEVKNFAVENIVTTSIAGTNNVDEVNTIKADSSIEKMTVNAAQVLQFH